MPLEAIECEDRAPKNRWAANTSSSAMSLVESRYVRGYAPSSVSSRTLPQILSEQPLVVDASDPFELCHRSRQGDYEERNGLSYDVVT